MHVASRVPRGMSHMHVASRMCVDAVADEVVCSSRQGAAGADEVVRSSRQGAAVTDEVVHSSRQEAAVADEVVHSSRQEAAGADEEQAGGGSSSHARCTRW